MEQIKHSKQEFLQEVHGFTKPINNADKYFFRDSIHINRSCSVTSAVVIIVPFTLIYFMADHVRLKALVTGLTNVTHKGAMVQTEHKMIKIGISIWLQDWDLELCFG